MSNPLPSPSDTTPPTIVIVSPENKSYPATNVSLTFTVNETVFRMAHSLDGQSNVAITENTTLTKLPEGSHSVIVYAKDTAGNAGASEIICFNIEPFPIARAPIILIVAVVVIIATVGAVLLIYFTNAKKTIRKAA